MRKLSLIFILLLFVSVIVNANNSFAKTSKHVNDPLGFVVTNCDASVHQGVQVSNDYSFSFNSYMELKTAYIVYVSEHSPMELLNIYYDTSPNINVHNNYNISTIVLSKKYNETKRISHIHRLTHSL